MQDVLKIFTASLIGNKKFQAVSVFSESRGLVIVQVLPISGMFGAWRQPLIETIEKWKNDGAAVLIEENGDTVSQYGTKYLLEDMDDDNCKTNLATAIDAYFQLQDSDMLIIPQEYQRYALQSGNERSWIEKKNDDKGRAHYNIDWSKFNAAHRAILLSVVAALYEPLSERFLAAMWSKNTEEYEGNPVKRWRNMFDAMSLEKGRRIMEARGQR